MTEVMSMEKDAIIIPYGINDDGTINFGEPRRKTVTVRYTKSCWVDVDMQPIQNYLTCDTDYVITSQYYIFVI